MTLFLPMERVCSVETWAEFGCRFPVTAQVIRSPTEVLICPGNNDIYIFNKEELKLTAVLQFPAHVYHLVLSDDKQLLYAVCDKQGVYCVHLDSLLPRSLAPSSATDLALRNVTADWLAVRDEEVCSVILVGRTLLTVSLCETAWLFSIYRTPSSSAASSAPDHQKISQFSLPAVSAFLHDDSKENAGRGLGMQPVLACVYSSDTAVPLSSASLSLGDQHFLIETLLFKLLFGVDAALLKSPIILCGLPDGRLCFLPMLFLGQPEPRVKVLHSLDQPITFIGTSIAPEIGVGSRCVVVVGHQGTVVLVHAQEAGPEEGVKVASFSEGCVPGPVVCVCPGQKCLYYSTESDLWELDLLGGGGGGEEAGPGEGGVLLQAARPGKVQCVETIQCPISLGVTGVIALTGLSYTQTSGAVQLVALSSRGRLQRLLLPQRSKDGGLPQLPPSQVGQRIRDLLAAIGDIWERASVLKSTSQSRNQTLKHLNQVLNISCLLLAYRSHGESPHTQQKPIRCGVVPSWSRLLQKDSLSLTCVLDNSSPYVLEDGWTLCVQVLPLCRSCAEGGGNTSRTFSFRLSRVEAGEKTDVSLPLSTVASFPVTISCSLVFSLQSLLGREEMAGLLAKGKTAVSALGLDNTGYVTLALDMLTVDWLDALKVKEATPTQGITFARSVSTDTVAMDTIQAYLSSCGFRRAGGGDGAGGVETEGRLFSARVVVSSAILKSALKPRAPDSAPLGGTGSPELGGLVLDWLLSQGSGGQERREGGDHRGLGSPVVYAMAPGGHAVKLTATEVTVGEVTLEEENLAAVEVKVESSSVAAVCGLHHAVLRRVQVLLQSVAGTCFSSLSVQGLRLRQALQRAEALLQKIQESRIPEAFGQETMSEQVTTTLLSVYQQIRENPLIIT